MKVRCMNIHINPILFLKQILHIYANYCTWLLYTSFKIKRCTTVTYKAHKPYHWKASSPPRLVCALIYGIHSLMLIQKLCDAHYQYVLLTYTDVLLTYTDALLTSLQQQCVFFFSTDFMNLLMFSCINRKVV